jgi:hypothetical protein
LEKREIVTVGVIIPLCEYFPAVAKRSKVTDGSQHKALSPLTHAMVASPKLEAE